MMDLFADIDKEARRSINWKPPSPPNLEKYPILVLDTETSGLKWWGPSKVIGIAISPLGERSMYLPFAHLGGGNLDEQVVKRWAIRELRNKIIIGHNIRFDNHMLYEWGVDLEAQGCQLFDTGHCAALLDDHRKKFSLDALCKEFLGVEGKLEYTSFTKQAIDKSRMASYHAGEIAAYAEMDVNLTGDLWEHFQIGIGEQNLKRVLDLESRTIYPVCEMERNALPLDLPLLVKWEKESREEFEECLWEIHRQTGLNMNPNSTKDWSKLFRLRDVEFTHRTAKGNASFTNDVIKNIKDPVIQTARRSKLLASLRSKYIVAYIERCDEDGRIRTQLHQLRGDEGGTISGRFSSSGYRIKGEDGRQEKIGFNGQQVFAVEKQKANFGDNYIVRQLFVAGSGKFFSVDAEQIEYRIFAHFANSERIIGAYQKDPWLKYHKLVWGMLKKFKPDLLYKTTKNLNFAYIYGAGEDKLAEMLELPASEARRVVDVYEQEIPEARTLLTLAMKRAREKGFVHTITGRRSRFPGAKMLHKALNTVIQGTAADVMKQKTIELHEAIRKGEIDAKLRLTVHDELVGDVADKENGKKILDLLNKQAFELKVPILWGMNVANNWKECADERTAI